jgi:hypothetical protein
VYVRAVTNWQKSHQGFRKQYSTPHLEHEISLVNHTDAGGIIDATFVMITKLLGNEKLDNKMPIH